MIVALIAALAGEPVAVVELFTSEGCSSCPSADRVLSKLVESDRPNVYALSYHVDYWDRLGWKDPYGDPRWTTRQRDYNRAWRRNRIYTPQAVVNGRHQLVGSHGQRLDDTIREELERPSEARVRGNARRVGEEVEVEVTATGAPIGATLFVAVVEDRRVTRIERGENAGTEATHRNVVRGMVTASAPGARGRIALPSDFAWSDARVFAWVADPLDLHIVGATRIPLTP